MPKRRTEPVPADLIKTPNGRRKRRSHITPDPRPFSRSANPRRSPDQSVSTAVDRHIRRLGVLVAGSTIFVRGAGGAVAGPAGVVPGCLRPVRRVRRYGAATRSMHAATELLMAVRMKLTAITLDCADPMALAMFYQQATGLELVPESDDDFAGLAGDGGLFIGFQRVDDYRAAQWPGQARSCRSSSTSTSELTILTRPRPCWWSWVRPSRCSSPAAINGGCSPTQPGTPSVSRSGAVSARACVAAGSGRSGRGAGDGAASVTSASGARLRAGGWVIVAGPPQPCGGRGRDERGRQRRGHPRAVGVPGPRLAGLHTVGVHAHDAVGSRPDEVGD